jgi:phage terminase large subunit
MTAKASRIELPHQWAPREYQKPLWSYMHGGGKRALAIWPRRHGKDDVALHYTACAAHERVGVYWHLLPQQNQARKAIWNAVNPHTGRRRIDDAFPKELRENTREDEMFIRFKTGSTWQVIGSDNYDALVGTPPIGVVFSEWALSNPQAWSLIRPILLENGGWSMFITTPRGRNHAHRMFQMAEQSDDWFSEHLTSTETGVFTPEALAGERAELLSERGDADGDAIFEQEYMCSWSAALPGAYYARDVDKLEKEGALTRVPHNPSKPVHTAWDLGAHDTTVIWFLQRLPGGGWAVIDYVANTSVGHDWYAKQLLDKPYIYGEHLLPHDAENQNLALPDAGNIAESLRGLGLKNVRVVPRTSSVANDINEVRKILPLCVFDQAKCAHGIDALRSYRRKWDENLKAYQDKPLHDWASHPADAFRTFAVGKPEDPDESHHGGTLIIPSFGAA